MVLAGRTIKIRRRSRKSFRFQARKIQISLFFELSLPLYDSYASFIIIHHGIGICIENCNSFVVCVFQHNNSCSYSFESCLENPFFSTTIFLVCFSASCLLQVMQDWLSISKILNRLCALRSMCLSKLLCDNPLFFLTEAAQKRDDHSNLSLHPKQYVLKLHMHSCTLDIFKPQKSTSM